MGDYSYSEHLEMFGGPPEPGEGVDWREWADLERTARKEEPEPPFAREMRLQMESAARELEHPPAPRRPWWRRWRRGA